MTDTADITVLLNRMQAGDRAAGDAVYAMIYPTLKTIARSRTAAIGAGKDLTPTALVNESFLKLIGGRSLAIADRAHFYRLAAKAMREILLDSWRKSARAKHGGDLVQADYTESQAVAEDAITHLLDLNSHLSELEQIDDRMRAVFEMHYFLGLDFAEIGGCLELSSRTVRREWKAARMYLASRLAERC